MATEVVSSRVSAKAFDEHTVHPVYRVPVKGRPYTAGTCVQGARQRRPVCAQGFTLYGLLLTGCPSMAARGLCTRFCFLRLFTAIFQEAFTAIFWEEFTRIFGEKFTGLLLEKFIAIFQENSLQFLEKRPQEFSRKSSRLFSRKP